MTSSNRNRKLYLLRKDPHCYWCGREVFDHDLSHKSHPPYNTATVDHLITRYSSVRGEVKGETVLSCWKCNNDRSKQETSQMPKQLRVAISGRFGKKFDDAIDGFFHVE